MSAISMDDLVSSLSSTCNIGQEAQDLAALQAQLALSLSQQPTRTGQAIPLGQNCAPPCTPTRTPTNGFEWPSAASFSNSAAWREIEELEDEQMVEDLLVPSSPMTTNATNPANPPSLFSSPSTTSLTNEGFQHHSNFNPSVNHPGPYGTESSTSVFASTDPFYVAQVLAMQSGNAANGGLNPTSPSLFFQMGKPSLQSPFVQQTAQQQQSPPPQTQHHREHYATKHDNRSLFISTFS